MLNKCLFNILYVVINTRFDCSFSASSNLLLFFSVISDFNECSLNNAGCEHVCNNTAGSFNCDCRAGFKLKADKMGCEGKCRCF